MKTIHATFLTFGLAGLLLTALAQDNPPPDNGGNPPPPPEAGGNNGPGDVAPPQAPADMTTTNDVAEPAVDEAEPKTNAPPVVILPGQTKRAAEMTANGFMPPTEAISTNQNDLTLNFNRAPLEMVLNYLSDAADFIIVQDTRVNGSVTVTGKHLTKDEAVDLLNSVLNKNGYAAIRNGRTLTIVDKNEAKTRNIPVKTSNNPDQIPNNAEIVTQIIPIRFVEARQLISDLTSFVSPQATVVANEAGNAIVITDTQQNIKHLTEIIKAIDGSAEAETEIRVFRLKYASPTDVASELTSIFPSSGSSGGNTQTPIRFGGGMGGGPGGFFRQMMAGGGNNSGNSSSDRIKKATQVNAVADSRIQAVIVTAPKDLMDQIASMMTELDVASTRDTKPYVFKINNADPQQALQVLNSMFGSQRGSTTSSSSQNSLMEKRSQNNTQATGTSGSSSSGFGTTGYSGGRTGQQF